MSKTASRGRFLTVVLALIAVFFVWKAVFVREEPLDLLEKRLGRVFAEYGLTEDSLVRRTSEERGEGKARYRAARAEYALPKDVSWTKFDRDVRSALKGTKFRVTKTDRSSKKGVETCFLSVNYGALTVLDLKVSKKKAAKPLPVVKAHAHPKVAIVMDDFGYTESNLATFFAIGKPITLSILPNQRYSREVATLAKARGYEVILHLPLEAHSRLATEEQDTIKAGLSERDIAARLSKELESVPGVDGVSNHQGSKSTEDRMLMTTILAQLKKRNLYFFDSLTSQKSVCSDVAKSVGIKCAKRDIFLDNSSDPAAIEEQVNQMRRMAFAEGSVIAVCHDRKNTVSVLAKTVPELAREGIEFVYLSEMVR